MLIPNRVAGAMRAVEASREKATASAAQISAAKQSLHSITTTVASIADMIARIAEASKAVFSSCLPCQC